jgi:hypothetical protein
MVGAGGGSANDLGHHFGKCGNPAEEGWSSWERPIASARLLISPHGGAKLFIMLTPTQARLVAAELVEQERRRLVERKNAAAKAVPWLYRVRELERLEPWERSERVESAKAEVDRQWVPTLTAVAWLALVSGTAWLSGALHGAASWFTTGVLLWILPLHLIRAAYVRRALRRLSVEP